MSKTGKDGFMLLNKGLTVLDNHAVAEADQFQIILDGLPEDVRSIMEPVLKRALDDFKRTSLSATASIHVSLESQIFDVRRTLDELRLEMLDAALEMQQHPEYTTHQQFTEVLSKIKVGLYLAPPTFGPWSHPFAEGTWDREVMSFENEVTLINGARLLQPIGEYQFELFIDGATHKRVSAKTLITHNHDVQIAIPMSELANHFDKKYTKLRMFHDKNPERYAELIILHRDKEPPPPRLERITRVELFNLSKDDKSVNCGIVAVLSSQGRRVAEVHEWGMLEVFRAETNGVPVYSTEMLLKAGSGPHILREVNKPFPTMELTLSVRPKPGEARAAWKGKMWINVYTEYDDDNTDEIVSCCYTSRESIQIAFSDNYVDMPNNNWNRHPAFLVKLDFSHENGSGDRKIESDQRRPRWP